MLPTGGLSDEAFALPTISLLISLPALRVPTWIRLTEANAPLPGRDDVRSPGRRNHGMATRGTKVYVFGGQLYDDVAKAWSSSVATNMFHQIETNTADNVPEWTQLAYAPVGAKVADFVMFEALDKLWVWGGVGPDGRPKKAMWSAQFFDGTALEPLWSLTTEWTGDARSKHCGAYINGQAFFFGGIAEADAGTLRNNLLAYSPSSDTWKDYGTLPSAPLIVSDCRMAGVELQKRLYMYGGTPIGGVNPKP
jgi:hypothetical protein